MTEGKDEATGRFLPGNRFWEARSSHGPKPKFDNPDDLWAACVEYFEWVADNPLYEDKITSFQGVNKHEPIAKMRAMTIQGLCLFLDIDETTWRDWVARRSDLSPIISRAEAVIRQQKFSGAAADLLNANIIARDLGLADKSELTGRDGGPVETKDVSDRDLAKALAAILTRGVNAQS